VATVGGVRVVFDRFPEIIAKLEVGGDQAVQATAEAIASQARSSAPHLTGALASSIGVVSEGASHAAVTADIRYAAYVEYGTAKHGAAQPYLTPAAHNEEPNFMARMQGLVG
jgi:hypothetical protein